MAARQNAHNIEMTVYNTATSEEEYDEMLEARLENIIATSKNRRQVNDAHSVTIPSEVHGSLPTHAPGPPTKLIGIYTATYHAAGTFSTVYRATDPSSSPPDRLVALKVTTPSQSQPPHDPHREIRILQHAAHPSIITLLSTFTLSSTSALVLAFPFMPLDLATFIRAPSHVRKNGIFKSQVRSHLYSLFQALAHLHSLGIIHRDIKPSNILLAAPSGPAYLADFGIAWMEGDAASEKADEKITDVGTTCYRPPELLFGSTTYGTALDLWSAGCVVAEAVGGRPHSSEHITGRELFDAGPAGSELGLIKSIFETLGTPDDETWPEARGFSAWGKMQFKVYPKVGWEEVLPEAEPEARELVGRLVRFESGERMVAGEVLKHAFFG